MRSSHGDDPAATQVLRTCWQPCPCAFFPSARGRKQLRSRQGRWSPISTLHLSLARNRPTSYSTTSPPFPLVQSCGLRGESPLGAILGTHCERAHSALCVAGADDQACQQRYFLPSLQGRGLGCRACVSRAVESRRYVVDKVLYMRHRGCNKHIETSRRARSAWHTQRLACPGAGTFYLALDSLCSLGP